jgi:hypothetical protein
MACYFSPAPGVAAASTPNRSFAGCSHLACRAAIDGRIPPNELSASERSIPGDLGDQVEIVLADALIR